MGISSAGRFRAQTKKSLWRRRGSETVSITCSGDWTNPETRLNSWHFSSIREPWRLPGNQTCLEKFPEVFGMVFHGKGC